MKRTRFWFQKPPWFVLSKQNKKKPDLDSGSDPKPFKDIPSPTGWPLLGNVPMLMMNRRKMHELHEKLRSQYGDIYKLKIPGKGKDMVCIVNPQDAATLLRNDGTMPILPNFQAAEKIRRRLKKFTTAGLFSQGEEWHKFRRAVQQELMRPTGSTFYIPELNLLVDDVIRKLMTRHVTPDGSSSFGLHDLMQEYSLEATAVTFLGSRIGALEGSETAKKLINAVDQLFATSAPLIILPERMGEILGIHQKAQDCTEIIFDICEAKIREAILKMESGTEEAERLQNSVLGKMIKRNGKDSVIPIVMAIDSLFAGTVSTGSTCSFLLYHLAANPGAQEMLYEEICTHMGSGPMTEQAYNSMRYLKACQAESQRIFPVAIGTLRRTQFEMVLGGYTIPTQTQVLRLGILGANDPNIFKEPAKFMPERFLRKHSAHDKSVHPFAFLPFGHGPRSCIGQRFAKLEVNMLAAILVQRYKMSYKGPDIGMNLDRSMGYPDHELTIKFTPR